MHLGPAGRQGRREVPHQSAPGLKHIYVDGELETIDTTNRHPKVIRKDGNFACGAEANYNGYCNAEVDRLIDRQSMETDQEKRRQLVWEIERRLAEDGARPIMYYTRGGICWRPYVKGLTVMVNSIYNGWRMEDVWLDR